MALEVFVANDWDKQNIATKREFRKEAPPLIQNMFMRMREKKTVEYQFKRYSAFLISNSTKYYTRDSN